MQAFAVAKLKQLIAPFSTAFNTLFLGAA